jgi:MinD-like ATPase involved in chromosome partitioning or flagellar assembly
MSKKISFYSPKGGVGKTTLAANFAAFLSSQNKKVAFVDLDPQHSAKEILPAAIDYKTSDVLNSDADFVVYDFPPGATLSHKPVGLVVLVSNPSRLSIKDTFLAIKKGDFKRYVVALNRYQQNVKNHRELKDDLLAFIKQANRENADSKCLSLTIKSEHKAVQSTENLGKTLFTAEYSDAAKIYNFAKAKAEFENFFKSILDKL